MKRILILIAATIFLLAFTACGKTGEPAGTETPSVQTNETSMTAEPKPIETQQTETIEATPDPVAVYDMHDFGILRVFFEIRDETGVSNGEKCFASYDPDDPTTWVGGTNNTDRSVLWDKNGNVIGINLRNADESVIRLCGKLELSSLEKLRRFYAWNIALDEVTAEDILSFSQRNNDNTLVVTMTEGEAVLRGGYVESIFLRSAVHVRCDITGEAESDVSVLPVYNVDIYIEGSGYAGVSIYTNEYYRLSAEAKDGESFVGWYDSDGNLVSTDADYEFYDLAAGQIGSDGAAVFSFTARFE